MTIPFVESEEYKKEYQAQINRMRSRGELSTASPYFAAPNPETPTPQPEIERAKHMSRSELVTECKNIIYKTIKMLAHLDPGAESYAESHHDHRQQTPPESDSIAAQMAFEAGDVERGREIAERYNQKMRRK